MNIFLLDLNHNSGGVHTNTVPLGMGLIAKYMEMKIPKKLNIRMFKDYKKLEMALKQTIPDVVGISQYSWNSRLNQYAARIIKNKHQNVIIIAGGPNMFLTPKERTEYLKENEFIDICISYDGEIPFCEIVNEIINGVGIKEIKQKNIPGTYSLLDEELIESKEFPRLTNLDIFGAMYADGRFDEFLDDGYFPFIQTQRGCPFTCAYCHTSDRYYSHILFIDSDVFKKDMEYLGKKFKGKHTVYLFLADTNFGLYEKDFHTAKIIRSIQDKYDWPKYIIPNFASKPKNLLKLLEIFKYKVIPAISLQTTTEHVLKNINRKNIPFSEFMEFQNTVLAKYGEVTTSTELILSLPDETLGTFLSTIEKVVDSNVQNIVVYTLLSLRGTPLSMNSFKKKYGHKIKYRLVPRCYSEINGDKIFEAEEAVIGTNTLSYEEYLYLRKFVLTIFIFLNSIDLYPIRKLIKENGIKLSTVINHIHNKVDGVLTDVYQKFMEEANGELFATEKELVDYYTENYNLLKTGELGDNLFRKYKTIALYKHLDECIDLMLSEVKLDDVNLMEDMRTYLKTRNMKGEYGVDLKNATLMYNIPEWVKNEKLECGKFLYEISISKEMEEKFNNMLKSFQNKELSLQISYRDNTIKDYWPVWSRK